MKRRVFGPICVFLRRVVSSGRMSEKQKKFKSIMNVLFSSVGVHLLANLRSLLKTIPT